MLLLLQAAMRCGISIRVFALDKNPNAVVALRNLIRTEGWSSTVTVVSGDMRQWQAPCHADIMVCAGNRGGKNLFFLNSELNVRVVC
jgi:precorrin-6B methylase 2